MGTSTPHTDQLRPHRARTLVAALLSVAAAMTITFVAPPSQAFASNDGQLTPGTPGTGVFQAWKGDQHPGGGWGQYPVCLYHNEDTGDRTPFVVACSNYEQGGSWHGYSDLWVRTTTGRLVGGYVNGQYQCLAAYEGILPEYVTAESAPCTEASNRRWIFRDNGQIEAVYHPGYCLTFEYVRLWWNYKYGTLKVRECSDQDDRQFWKLPPEASGTDLSLLCDIPGAGSTPPLGARENPPAATVDSPRAPAVITKITTWNMQGSCASTVNKWNTVVLSLLQNNGLVALQEAGTVPVSAQTPANPAPVTGAAGFTVTQHVWGRTVSGRGGYNIYWLQTDPRGNRVNLSIVTRQQADEVVVVPNPNPYAMQRRWRPALGILIGTVFYFTVHLSASGGGDAQELIAAINAYVTGRGPNFTWVAVGDFNRAPGTWTPPPNAVVDPPDQPTHNANNPQPRSIYDYMVVFGVPIVGQVGTVLQAVRNSDHFPVEYRIR